MIVADAISAIGSPYADADAGDLVIVQFRQGRPIHRTLDTASDLALTTDTYLATGAFRAGSITSSGGRTLDNLVAILSLPYDCDLSDHTGLDKATLHQLPDDDLDALIDDLRSFAVAAFAAIGLAPNRIDVTGYGIALHLNIAHDSQRDIAALRDMHRRIGQQVNRQVGERLVDEQALDAGTRIMRLPPSPNTKRADRPRQARTLHNDEGAYDIAQLRAVCDRFGDAPEPVRRIVPNHGRELSAEAEQRIVAAMSGAWSHGQRHAIALGLAGWLAKSGIPQAQTLRIIAALSSGDGEEARDRERAVETTYRHVESGSDAAGYTALQQRLPAAVLATVDEVLTAYRSATAPSLVIGSGRAATPPVHRIAPLPDEAFYGVLGEYVDLAAPTTEAADQFHVGAFLAVISAQAGRRFVHRYTDEELYCNLFVLLVGKSGSSRKDTAINRALRVTSLPWSDGVLPTPPWHVSRDVSSGEGLISLLKDHPNTLLRLSELTSMTSKSERKGSESLNDYLINAYDCAETLENNSKVNPVIAELPYLTAIAATQPGRMEGAFTTRAVQSGLGNRWLIVPGRAKSAMPNPPGIDQRRAAALWRRIVGNIQSVAPQARSDGRIVPTPISLDDACLPLWSEYYGVEHELANDDDADETVSDMRQRLHVQVRKISMLLALTDGEITIRLPHLRAALAIVNWSWTETMRLIDLWNPSIESRIERRVLDVLASQGAMSNAKLQQTTRNRAWSATEYNRVIKALIEVGAIVRDAENTIALGTPR